MKVENTVLVKVENSDLINGTFTLPEGVTSIGAKAFVGCSSLRTLILPESITSIGDFTFDGCSSLSTLTLPKGLKSIGRAAFADCSSLSTLILPESVTSIDGYAFSGCINLKTITLPKGLKSIDESAFARCSSLTTVTFPEGVESIGDFAFSDCSSLSTLTLPKGLKSTGGCAFCSCHSLTTLTLPKGLKSIDDAAFRDCRSLRTLILPESITSIGDAAFYGCSSLSTLIIETQSEAEFERIKALLPEGLRSKADRNGERAFKEIISPLEELLSTHPDAIEDEKLLDKINTGIEAAQEHLERIQSNPTAYQAQKKEFDALVVRFHLHQGDTAAALEHLIVNPNLDDDQTLTLASEIFTLNTIDDAVKHKAVIALFKGHYQNQEVNALLTQSVLSLLNQKPATLDDRLSNHQIGKCLPLSVIKEHLEHVIQTLGEGDELKEPLTRIQNQLHLLTQQEILALLAIPPIKEAFEENPELGCANILPFESFYTPQPAQRELPVEPSRFLRATLQLMAHEKRAAQHPVDASEQSGVDKVLNTLGKPIQSAAGNGNRFFSQSDKPAPSSETPDETPSPG